MKKIGIMTIVNYNNYGNKLQNYSTQEIIKSLGYEAETIINEIEYKKIKNLIKFHKLRIFDRYPRIKMESLLMDKVSKNKINRFIKFSNKYINESNYKIYLDDVIGLNHNEYYKFIVGSDQIWNPNFRRNGNSNDFLCFAPKNKRIAFSPSIGVSKLTEIQEKKYSKWLKDIENLSCREEEGANIIARLTNRKVEVLVDPTMVLEKEKWIEFSSPHKGKTNDKYLLTYFLGPVSDENKKRIKTIASENNLKIVNLNDKNKPELYAIDPCEWVDYVNGAEFFCTDSFHGVVFSIIMETPFSIFNRGGKIVSMNSRIDTILKKFNFENRHWDKLKESKEYFNINFDHCEKILEAEREKSIKYLKKSLES